MRVRTLFVVLSFIALLAAGQTLAQTTSELILTWKSLSYVPADFGGKALPSEGTLVQVAADVISQGKPLNLSDQVIRWYLGGSLLKSARGAQNFSFRPIKRGVSEVRVEIPGLPGGSLSKTLSIPVVKPEAVIVSPSPLGTFSGKEIILGASPYFFNISSLEDLELGWLINRKAPEDLSSPSVLTLAFSPEPEDGFRVTVELAIKNKIGAGESATDFVKLVFNK